MMDGTMIAVVLVATMPALMDGTMIAVMMDGPMIAVTRDPKPWQILLCPIHFAKVTQ
jgi:hypothetical protein